MAGTAQGPWAAQGQARRCFYARARACVHMRGHTCVQLAPSAPRLAVLGAACLRRWREAALRLGAARGSSFLWRAAQRGGIGGTASDVQLGQNVCDLLGLRLAGPMSGRAPPPPCRLLFFSMVASGEGAPSRGGRAMSDMELPKLISRRAADVRCIHLTCLCSCRSTDRGANCRVQGGFLPVRQGIAVF